MHATVGRAHEHLHLFGFTSMTVLRLEPGVMLHRYVKSRSDTQLRGTGNDLSSTSDCNPAQVLQSDRSKLIMPCGLVAWSYFNDTYAVGLQGLHMHGH